MVRPRSQSQTPRVRQASGREDGLAHGLHIRPPGIVARAGDSEAGGHFAQALDGLDPLRMSGRHATDGGRPGGAPPARAKAPADEDDNDIR